MTVPEISVQDLAARMATGPVNLFDVRNPDEFVEAHVAGATLIPLPEVGERVEEFPTNGEVLVICRTGARSAAAVRFLRANGVDATNVAGGTMEWIAVGQPVESGGA